MELIKITEQNGKKLVSARELHLFLEIETRFDIWINRMLEYGFTLNVDCTKLDIENEIVDYALTVEMAKELSMIQRTKKGKQARLYFIECEKKLQANLPTTYLDALKALVVSEEQKQLAHQQIKELTPRAEMYDTVMDSKDEIDISEAAKVLQLPYGRNTLFKKLREFGILRSNNEPYQSEIKANHFRCIEVPFIANGETKIHIKTLVTQKGLQFLKYKLK